MTHDPETQPIAAASEYVFQADIEKMRADLPLFRDRLAILAGGLDLLTVTNPDDVDTIKRMHVHIGAVRIRFARSFENNPPAGAEDFLLISEIGSHIAAIERTYARTVVKEKI